MPAWGFKVWLICWKKGPPPLFLSLYNLPNNVFTIPNELKIVVLGRGQCNLSKKIDFEIFRISAKIRKIQQGGPKEKWPKMAKNLLFFNPSSLRP